MQNYAANSIADALGRNLREVHDSPITLRQVIDGLANFESGNASWIVMKRPPATQLETTLRNTVREMDDEIRDKIKPSVEEFLLARRVFFDQIDASPVLQGEEGAIENMMRVMPKYLQAYEDLVRHITDLTDISNYADDVFDSGIIDAVVNADFCDASDGNKSAKMGYLKPYFFAPIVLDCFASAEKIRVEYNEMLPQYSANFSHWLKELAYANICQAFTFATRHKGKTYRYKLGKSVEPTQNRKINAEISVAHLSRHIMSEFWTQDSFLATKINDNNLIEFRIGLIGEVNADDLRQLCRSIGQDFVHLKKRSAHVFLNVYTDNEDIRNSTESYGTVTISVEKKIEVKKNSDDSKQDDELAFDDLDELELELTDQKYNVVLFFDNAAFYKVRTFTTKDIKNNNSRIYRRSYKDTSLWIMRMQLMQYEAFGEHGFAKSRQFNRRLLKRLQKMAKRIHDKTQPRMSIYAMLSGSDCTPFIKDCPDLYRELVVSDEWDMATRVALLRLSPGNNEMPAILDPDAEDNALESTMIKLSPSQIFRRIIKSGEYHKLFSDGLFSGNNSELGESEEALGFLKNIIIQLDYSNAFNNKNSEVKFALFDDGGYSLEPITRETGQKECELISLVNDFLTAAFMPNASKTTGACNVSNIFTSAVMRYATHVGSAVFLYFYDAGIMRTTYTKVKYDDSMTCISCSSRNHDGAEHEWMMAKERAVIAAGGGIFTVDDAVRTIAVPGYDFRSEYAIKSTLEKVLSATDYKDSVDRIYNRMKREIADSCFDLGLSSYTLYSNARR